MARKGGDPTKNVDPNFKSREYKNCHNTIGNNNNNNNNNV
jgi:hypothetical protein